MKNKSSKYVMEDQLRILENIKEVEAPSQLYSQILRKIESKKNEFVSAKWILMAAAMIIILISFNIKLIDSKKDSSKSDFDVLFMIKSQNTFSYE